MANMKFLEKKLILVVIPTILAFTTQLMSQKTLYKPVAIGFYNVENLFDTQDNPEIRDDEFTPGGDKVWNQEKYDEKVANIASVISQLGRERCKEGLSLLGISEIENDTVIQSIVDHPLLASRNYGFVHHSSRDKRGIDVALIYDKDNFVPQNTEAYWVDTSRKSDKPGYKPRPTRDVLLVSGLLDDELIHITVNHWPSRSGGEKRTASLRNKAAQVNRHILDSLLVLDPKAKLIVMGDLNDDPNNDSLKKHLSAKKKTSQVEETDMFNPMYALFDKGYGSNAYRDRWSLFDQIVVSEAFINEDTPGYKFNKAVIYNKKFMIEKKGEYRGYPLRTFSGDVYQGGYSDHFPVYIYLFKES